MKHEDFLQLLKEEDFYTTALEGKKSGEFFAIGKRGRCYAGKFTVYDITVTEVDGKPKITYQGVKKSFRLLKDAVKFQFECLREIVKITYLINKFSFQTMEEAISILKTDKDFTFGRAQIFFLAFMSDLKEPWNRIIPHLTKEELKEMIDSTPVITEEKAKELFVNEEDKLAFVLKCIRTKSTGCYD